MNQVNQIPLDFRPNYMHTHTPLHHQSLAYWLNLIAENEYNIYRRGFFLHFTFLWRGAIQFIPALRFRLMIKKWHSHSRWASIVLVNHQCYSTFFISLLFQCHDFFLANNDSCSCQCCNDRQNYFHVDFETSISNQIAHHLLCKIFNMQTKIRLFFANLKIVNSIRFPGKRLKKTCDIYSFS